MNKELTKKILLTIGLALLIGIAVYLLVRYFPTFKFYKRALDDLKNHNNKEELWLYKRTIFTLVVLFIFLFSNILIYLFFICKIWFLKKIVDVKYSYQEYKEEREQKIQNKKKRKIEKLQKKINKLN